jgi:hypothetical protein
MAIVTNNFLVNGFSGMLGQTLVFKNLRGKTIVASRPRPAKTQSEQQRQNRSKFRQAATWAKTVLRDPQKKAYYTQKAKKLHLPNAYTAAITDYMRKPQLKAISRREQTITYVVRKKDFALPSGELRLSTVHETTLIPNKLGELSFSLNEQVLPGGWHITVLDSAGIRHVLTPGTPLPC